MLIYEPRKKKKTANPTFWGSNTRVDDGSWLGTPGTIQQIFISATLVSVAPRRQSLYSKGINEGGQGHLQSLNNQDFNEFKINTPYAP